MHDLRFAIRVLWLQKGFTAAAVLTLAIGLGANTAFFGLLDAALRPMALPDADQLVVIAADVKGDETGGFQFHFSTEQMKDFQQRADALSSVTGFMTQVGGLSAEGSGSSTTTQFWFMAVSDNFFSSLRVTPTIGTLFTKPSGSPVHVVLGHRCWTNVFGSDPNVIGKSVRIDGAPAVVIGVVSESFHGPQPGVEMDGYVTLDDYGLIAPAVTRWLYDDRKARALQLIARMKPTVTVAQAQASMDVLMSTLAVDHPDTDGGISARVMPERRARPLPLRAVSDAIPFVQFFGLAIAGFVLLLACMNVANLLLVRASARQREMAVRAALGASRARLVRLLVVEGLLLSGLGGVAGYLLGQGVTAGYLSRLDLGADVPLHLDTGFHWSVFGFSCGVALLTGIALGIWPAWRTGRPAACAALHDGGKGQSDSVSRQRLRRMLVIGQISGALSVLVVAGLFVRTLSSARHIDVGFDVDKLITVRLDPRHIGYHTDQTVEFYKELQRRIRLWSDVESTALAFSTPMSHLVTGGTVYIENRPLDGTTQPPAMFLNQVDHTYFETMGIRIARGRTFVVDDEPDSAATRRVAIINETMAEQYWPGEDPIGKRFHLHYVTDPLLEVIGVARDSKYVLVFESRRPYVYLPMTREQSSRTLHVRTTGDPAALAPRLEKAIRDLAPTLPIADLRPLRQSLSGMFGYLIFRVGAIQAGGMGVLGMMLAIVGVYGVVSFSASLRTREIGIRIALGADRRSVLRLVLGQGLVLVVIGIILGTGISVALGRVLSSFVPLVDGNDWATFAGVAGGLSLLALLACYVPARRAAGVSVMTALRHE